MRTSTRRGTALAGGLALLAGAGAPLLGGPAADLAIQGWTVDGNVLHIAVVNTGDRLATGTVLAGVLTPAGAFPLTASVTVGEGQKVFVSLSAPAPVTGVIQAGVVLDDGSPF